MMLDTDRRSIAPMRLLFVTNLYPPVSKGGYEQWCYEVAVDLAARGHRVEVLTSRPPAGPVVGLEDGLLVRRTLHLEVVAGLGDTLRRVAFGRARRLREDVDEVRRAIHEGQPDACLLWGMWNLPRVVPATVEQELGDRVLYYLCDYWPALPSAYVQQLSAPSRRRVMGLPKRLAHRLFARQLESATPSLRLHRVLCVSQGVRDEIDRLGVVVGSARVVHGGIRLDPKVPDAAPTASLDGPDATGLRLLYAGRLTPEKGVATAIRALRLVVDGASQPVTLDVVGSGDAGFEAELRSLARGLGLERHLRFVGQVPEREMPAVLAGHDVLVFPSEWAEPFARTVLQAMASGLTVVGTTTGGTGEVLVHDETGLTFPPGDAVALAGQVLRLLAEPGLSRRLAVAGQRRVTTEHGSERMVDDLEGALAEACRGALALAR